MKYNCGDCNYSTYDKANWARHNKSKNHLKKVEDVLNSKKLRADNNLPGHIAGHMTDNTNEEKLTCQYCNQSFSSRSSLYRHKNHRCSKNIDDNESDDKSKKSKKQLEKENDELRKENEYFKSFAEKSMTTANKSVSALNFVIQNYPDAQLLKPMKDYLAIENDAGEDGLAVGIIELHKKKKSY